MALSDGWLSHVLGALSPPSPKEGLRVLGLEVGPAAEFGIGKVVRNPWLKSSELPWPLDEETASDLTARGLPLALVDALARSSQQPLQQGLLLYLHSLVELSKEARDQLNRHKRLPLTAVKWVPLDSKARAPAQPALAAEVEKLCKQRLSEVEHEDCVGDWTGWVTSYEVWLHRPQVGTTRVRVRGVDKGCGMFDFGGVHLTGGRVWAGSFMLTRWIASIGEDSPIGLGPGPLLEIGAGVGFVGIGLGKLGKRVVMSDREPTLLDRMRDNIEANEVEAQCKVLNLDWAKVGEPKMQRLLGAQNFAAVIGADLVYEGEPQVRLVADVLRHALPQGGLGLFMNARWHRKVSADVFTQVLRDSGFEVEDAVVPSEPVFQEAVCGYFEPDQEYVAFVVRVPPLPSEGLAST